MYPRNILPEEGLSYMIKVTHPSYPTATATNKVPVVTPIQNIRLFDKEVTPSIDGKSVSYGYKVELDYDDPVNEQNFYHVYFYQELLEYAIQGDNDTVIVNQLFYRLDPTPLINRNELTASFEGGFLFEDRTFNFALESKDIGVNLEHQILGRLFVELRTVSEDYYLYFTSRSRQLNSPVDPLVEPVFLYHNIENGKGLFGGYNRSVAATPIN